MSCQDPGPVPSLKKESSENHKGSFSQLNTVGPKADTRVAQIASDTQEQSILPSLTQDITERSQADIGMGKAEDRMHRPVHRHPPLENSDAQSISSSLSSVIQEIIKKPIESPEKQITLNSSRKLVSEMEAYLKGDSGLPSDLFTQKVNPDASMNTQSIATRKIKIQAQSRSEENVSEIETKIKENLDVTQQENLPQISDSLEEQPSMDLAEESSLKDQGNRDATKVLGTISEITSSEHDVGTQADMRLSYKSVAISPINPSDGSSAFTFQTETKCKETRTQDTLLKTCSIELTPPQQDVGTQADTRVPCISVAVSPINLTDGSSTFTFQTETKCKETRTPEMLLKTCSIELTPPQQDAETQADTRVPCKSVAVSPIFLMDGSSTFTFQTEIQSGNSVVVPPTSKTSFELSPSQQDAGTQADTRAPCISVAVSPINLMDGSSAFTFQTETKCKETRTPDTIKTTSTELTPFQQDAEIQADSRVPCISVALSPINLMDGCSTFTFQTETKFKDTKTPDSLLKTSLNELTPSQQDVGTQADTRVPCMSVAVSPINLTDGSSAFTFQTETKCKETRTPNTMLKTNLTKLASSQQDAEMQADTRVPCISVAVSPINITDGSSAFIFQTETKCKETRTPETLLKTCSIELTPSQQDVGIQADTRVPCMSVAVSPINPPDGSSAFAFQAEMIYQDPSSLKNLEASKKDAEIQVSITAETRSIALGPMTPTSKSHQSSYPQVCVKRAQEGQPPEPVREVSWDEKGMTWEVYGASMEVEVLGMAIQKHLEKQIEEHGRQKVMTPQNTRTSSFRKAPDKGELKRQPSIFRTLLHNVRRPRCCSAAGPTME